MKLDRNIAASQEALPAGAGDADDKRPSVAAIAPRQQSGNIRESLPDQRGGYTQKAHVGGHKVYLRKASTYSSSGTPYCRPSDTAIAKLFISDRKAAPSLCMSIKISPRRPSGYLPVRR